MGGLIGRAQRARREGLDTATVAVSRVELAVSLDADELPVGIEIGSIVGHEGLCSRAGAPPLAVRGPEEGVGCLDVFRGVEGIVVAVGAEVLREVDRELSQLVAVVIDALSSSVVVAAVAIGAGVADLDVVGSVGVLEGEVAVAEVSIQHGLERLRLYVAVDENRDVDVQVSVVDAIAGMGFEDRQTSRSTVVERSTESAGDSGPRGEETVEMIDGRERVAGGRRGGCEGQHGGVKALPVASLYATFEVLQLRVLLR